MSPRTLERWRWLKQGPAYLKLGHVLYRAVYTVRFGEAVYVLHAFKKKSKQGIKTPQRDIDLVKQRPKAAEQDHAQRFKKEKK